MHRRTKLQRVFLSLSVIFCLVAPSIVHGQSGSLVQEAEQHWENYGVGGACNHGPHNLAVADVDGDGTPEILVGAFMYHVVNGSETPFEAPLEIWSWNGQKVTLEKEQIWDGSIDCVYVADADGDGVNEIFTEGQYRNETGSYGSLRVWHWNGEELTLVAHYEGVWAASVFVGDVDSDGVNDVIAVGRLDGDALGNSRLFLWHLDNSSLILDEALGLDAAGAASASSVYACDLDNDGETEIITGGYYDDLNNSKGQLSLWSWNGQTLSLKADEKWQIVSDCYAKNIAGGVLGNTVVNNLKVGDVDGDDILEIVTGGFTYDGESVQSQIKIWSWNGGILTEEDHAEWMTDSITLVYGLSLDDVDGDSRMEIVAGGMTGTYGSFATNETSLNKAQLTVWRDNGTTLTLEQSSDWTIGEGVCVWNVGTADLDKDGTTEIVTSGCMSINRLCDPDMRIWSIQQSSGLPITLIFIIAGAVATIIALSAAIFLGIKKRKKAFNHRILHIGGYCNL